MRIQGRILVDNKDNTSRKFITSDKVVCCNCGKRIKNKEYMFACSLTHKYFGRYVFCECLLEKGSGICPANSDHEDVYCQLEIEKVKGND